MLFRSADDINHYKPDENIHQYTNTHDQPPNAKFEISEATDSAVYLAIKGLKPRKASGRNGITGDIL